MKIGHILHLRPADLGDLTPYDLMGAVDLFDALYTTTEE